MEEELTDGAGCGAYNRGQPHPFLCSAVAAIDAEIWSVEKKAALHWNGKNRWNDSGN